MHRVRQPAVAGSFYAGLPSLLLATIDEQLDAARAALPETATAPKAVIVPHAGLVYSGSTAALAYSRLERGAAGIRRIVLLGPCHRVPLRGLGLSAAAAFATPLGMIPLVRSVKELVGLSQVVVSDEAHAPEHSLEVQLPFLQRVLGEFELLPIVVGRVTPDQVAEVIDALWGGPETVIVISSDLSHYHQYEEARRIDAGTIEQILALEGPLDHEQACGATPVNGMLVSAARHGLRPVLLGACNSGDTAGDKRRVVGYSAFAFEEGRGDG